MDIKDVIFDENYEVEDDFERNEEVKEEAVVSDEILEEVQEIKKEGCLKKTFRFVNIACMLASVIMCGALIYMKSLYAPGERQMDMSNVFDDTNAVVISDYQVKNICSLLEDEFGMELDFDNDNSLLLNAIYCNDNLSDSEKEFCSKYIKLFNDNPYLDKHRVYHSLLNVDISHKNRPYFYEDSVEGVYIDALKSIGIFVDDKDKNVIAHELIHCICSNDGDLPTFFSEGMTELLTNEYFSSSPFLEFENYPFEIYAVKMLCDTAGSDAVLKAFTTGDMTPVYDSLASYSGTVEDAKKAIDMFDDLFLTLNGDKSEFKYDPDKLTSELFEYLNSVAISKYGEDKENLYRSAFFYHEIMFLNLYKEDSHTALIADIDELGVFCIPYFSSELKEKFPEPVVGKLDTTTIVNEDEFQKKKIG